MAPGTTWVWRWRRLGRMSVWEIAYRIFEQLRRRLDRRRHWGWFVFGRFSGAVSGLDVFQRRADALSSIRPGLATQAQAATEGRFRFLGQDWPPPESAAGPWWTGSLWLWDPVSQTLWPGCERFAFDVAYRGGGPGSLDPNSLGPNSLGPDDQGDVKFVWELSRLNFLPPLALHAAATGQPGDAALVFEILRGWMAANPPYRGVNWASGIEAASRVVSLLAALAFAPPQTQADATAVRAFLHAHMRWIARYPSCFSSANNHRVAELAALLLAALCAPGLPRAARLAAKAQAGLERQMLRQFHPDGVGAEQSAAYAAYSLEWLTLAGAAADAAGRPFSRGFRRRAHSAQAALTWLLDDGGHGPAIGDGDDGRVLALTQAPEPRYLASVAAMAARWLGAPAPAERLRDPALRDSISVPTLEAPPPLGARTFPHGGLTVWRQARDDGTLLLIFDHGPLGHLSIAAHGHADALAVWLHWGEEAVFVDAGTYLYHGAGGARDALRATPAHNTLTLGGADQSRIVGPFAWARHARTRLIDATRNAAGAEHDGYRRRFGLIHRRRVKLEADAIMIEDRLVGRPKRPGLSWSAGFTLAPGIVVALEAGCAHLRTPAGRALTLSSSGADGTPIPWSVVQTPYAPAFGVLSAAPRLVLIGTADAPSPAIQTQIRLRAHQERPT